MPAPAVPDRDSSLRFKRASPPRIEEDYDRHRNMLAKSATGLQKMDAEIFHNASQEAQAPSSRTDQQKASREYGRRQIQATDGDNLDMQSLSIAGNGVDIDRASTESVSVNESNSDTRRSLDPIAKKSTIPTRKALPSRPQDHALRHRPSDTDLQEQAQPQAQPSGLSKREHHPQPSPLPSTTNDSNHTSSPPAPQDPLARLPPSLNPTNTIDTTMDTTVAVSNSVHAQKSRIRRHLALPTVDYTVHSFIQSPPPTFFPPQCPITNTTRLARRNARNQAHAKTRNRPRVHLPRHPHRPLPPLRPAYQGCRS